MTNFHHVAHYKYIEIINIVSSKVKIYYHPQKKKNY